jgi:hypothetical protein
MANYTIELKDFLKDYQLFDFEYTLFDPLYKPVLEANITDHFYFREIGLETPDRFKFAFKAKFLLILSKYNKYYMADNLEQRIMDNYDITETFTKTNTADTTTTTDGKTMFADTPQGSLTITEGFASNISENDDSAIINHDATETWTRTMKGNIGVQTDADAIKKYWETLINVDQMIIDELEDLFMGVY